jgi:hypothetical protein
MARLYLDTSVVIPLVEQRTPTWQALAAHLAALAGADSLYVVSDLVHMECLVKPFSLGDTAMRGLYEAYLDALTLLPSPDLSASVRQPSEASTVSRPPTRFTWPLPSRPAATPSSPATGVSPVSARSRSL